MKTKAAIAWKAGAPLTIKPLFHYMGTSTFSNYIVVPEIAVAKVREDGENSTTAPNGNASPSVKKNSHFPRWRKYARWHGRSPRRP